MAVVIGFRRSVLVKNASIDLVHAFEQIANPAQRTPLGSFTAGWALSRN
jgi:hypothetical protein